MSALDSPEPVGGRWLAGVRYPGGAEIWCSNRSGEAAWTTDKHLATAYLSESRAEIAARQLADGSSVPFWISAQV